MLLFMFFFTMMASDIFAMPHAPKKGKVVEKEVVTVKALTKKEQAKLEKKQAKLENKLKKVQKKLAKRGVKTTHARNVWNDDNFKLLSLIHI